MAIPKKSKEEIEREWAEFVKEQKKAFDQLLVEKGIRKKQPPPSRGMGIFEALL